ncbi:MAG: hypothetical protein ACI35W_00725 [Anaeroplasmataceae bacterium]
MEKYKYAELKLNEFSVPTHFHDMSVINMKFSNDSIQIRFLLAKYLDEFGILEDDKHFAILEVKYEGIQIETIDLEGVIDFRGLEVLRLTDINDMIELNIYNDSYDCYFNVAFTCKVFNWKIIDVVSEEEYYNYYNNMSENSRYLLKVQEFEGPKWSIFEE